MNQNDLKRLRGLQDKKTREQERRFLVQGRKVVQELLASDWGIERIIASEEAAADLGDVRAPVFILSEKERDRIGTFDKGNELIAIAEQPNPPGFRAPKAGELMLALDGVRDPRNMGGLLRIADWFGIRRVILSPQCMEPFNPKAVQSSMGSLFRVDLRRADDLAAELQSLQQAGTHVYLADMGGKPVFEAKLERPAVLVLGSESHGHSQAVEALRAEVIAIPRLGRAESLNVAMAAAALCVEFARQC